MFTAPSSAVTFPAQKVENSAEPVLPYRLKKPTTGCNFELLQEIELHEERRFLICMSAVLAREDKTTQSGRFFL